MSEGACSDPTPQPCDRSPDRGRTHAREALEALFSSERFSRRVEESPSPWAEPLGALEPSF